MKLDDIINKAVADDVLADWREYGIVGRGLTLNHEPTERLIAAFDPEHIRLMEAVCEAAERWSSEDETPNIVRNEHALVCATAALDAYRMERGIE